MSDNLTDIFNNLKKMVDSGNIPSEVQGLVNNLNNGNNDSSQTLNNMLNQVSPEMLNNISSMLQSNNTSNSSSNNANFNDKNNDNSNTSSSNFNLDMGTIMKMKSIMESMNQKNNPSTNLLYSLKPYLRDSRKEKLDQYANLLNVTKIADILKKDQKENN